MRQFSLCLCDTANHSAKTRSNRCVHGVHRMCVHALASDSSCAPDSSCMPCPFSCSETPMRAAKSHLPTTWITPSDRLPHAAMCRCERVATCLLRAMSANTCVRSADKVTLASSTRLLRRREKRRKQRPSKAGPRAALLNQARWIKSGT